MLFSKNDLNEFFLAILGRNMFFLLTLRSEIDSLEGRNYLDMWTITKENKLNLQKVEL